METKLLLSISISMFFVLSLFSCSEDNPDTPPFQFTYYIKYVDENGESLLSRYNKGNDDPIILDENLLSVKSIGVKSVDISTIYLPAHDCIKIVTTDFNKLFDKDVDFQSYYIVEIKMPEVIGPNITDEIVCFYHIQSYSSKLIHIKYNDQTIENEGSDDKTLVFTITVDK